MNRGSLSLHLVCPTCQHRAGEGDRHCVRCGSSLFQDATIACPGCGKALPSGHEPHCGQCGAYLRRSLRPLPHLARTRPALVLAGLLLASVALAWFRHHRGADTPESIAGVTPGSSPAGVESTLGKPARRTETRRFEGQDGRQHVAETWLYGLTTTNLPGLALVFIDDQVTQIGASHPRFLTRKGLGVGDRVEEAERLYGPGIETSEGGGLRAWRIRQGNTVLAAYHVGEGGAIVFIALESVRQPSVPPDTGQDDFSSEEEASPLGFSAGADRPDTDESRAGRPGS